MLSGLRWHLAALVPAMLACGGGDAVRTSPATAAGGADCVEHLDVTAREPMLVEHPDGVLFVAGYGRVPPTVRQRPRLWKSADGGTTWQRVDVGTLDDGAVGNSDVDLAVGPDGTLYFAAMGFERTTGTGTHVAIGVSRDVGESWDWHWLTRERFADRPWVRVASDGTAHAIWNDDSGVRYAVGTERGTTWTERPRIHPAGGSSHLAIGPDDELAVRISPIAASGNRFDEEVDLLAVSLDGGRTWAMHDPPGEREWTPRLGAPGTVPRWVEPLAWDADGALWHLWSEGRELRLGRSTDHGATWDHWTIVRSTDVMYFPYLTARGAGELAATWFSGRGDALTAHAARIDLRRGAAAPVVNEAASFQPDSWAIGAERVRDPAGEYLPIAFLSDGDVALVAPIQDEAAGRGGFCWRRIGQ